MTVAVSGQQQHVY